MSVDIIKHINSHNENRIEYLLVNFDYFDGNDMIAEFFISEYQMFIKEKVEGIHYTIIVLANDSTEYNFIWHEDVGNYIYSSKQDKASILELEKKLNSAVENLNKIL